MSATPPLDLAAAAGGTPPLGVMIERAAKLKMLQSSGERRRFDSFPATLQSTLYDDDVRVENARRAPFLDKLAVARAIKDDGNSSFGQQRFGDALKLYEQALSIFHYLENKNTSWRTSGIKDEDIVERRHDCGNDEDQKAQLSEFMVVCYNNCALAALKLGRHQHALQAAESAVEMTAGVVSSRSAKALYLRAKARLEDKTCGHEEQSLARSDLLASIECDPDNNAAKKMLAQLNKRSRAQTKQDKETFGGLFDRGEVYMTSGGNDVATQARDADATREEADILMAKRLAQHYAEQGDDEKKHQLEESIERATQKPSPSVRFDFRNPPKELLEDAKSHGVDLTDPATVHFLEELQEEEERKGGSPALKGKPAERTPTGRESPNGKAVEKRLEGNSISGAEALVRLIITAVLMVFGIIGSRALVQHLNRVV